jgi:hypothetical protein
VTQDVVGCLDADGDGFDSSVCGGDDCADGNAAVFPGADEVCNGIDDDCDGQIDADSPDATPANTTLCPIAGERCVAGACEPETPPAASELGLHGGLCSLDGRHAPTRGGSPWPWFVTLTSVLFGWRRRAPRWRRPWR